jgi:branched-subunit amino acid ABC-type transport system permease component
VLRQLPGQRTADILSVLLGIVIIIGMTRVLLRPLASRPTSELVVASITLVLLTVAFEFLFGHYVDRKSWDVLLSNYEIHRGRLWPIALAVVALTPFMWGRWFPQTTPGP